MKNEINLQSVVLILIALGIWAVVLQNAGIIPSGKQVEVTNVVRMQGINEYGNLLDINLRHINGWPAANYYEYEMDGTEFHSLGIEYINNPPKGYVPPEQKQEE